MSNEWHLITIVDPKYLPGKTIFDMIQILLNVIKFEYVVLDDVQGAGKGIIPLKKQDNNPMKIDSLLNIVCNVIQFDWADFFLFKNYPINWKNFEEMSYPEIIIQTDTTIRAVDDYYMYVYTPYKQIVHLIEENYEIESLKTDNLENLDYPY